MHQVNGKVKNGVANGKVRNGVANGKIKNGVANGVQNGKFYDPMSVTWTEKYSDKLEALWSRLPKHVGTAIATVAVFTLGMAINGDWMLFTVHFLKHLGYINHENVTHDFSEWSLEAFGFKDFWYFWIGSCCVSYGLYYSIGGFLHWYFYVRQRDKAIEWKCQPTKWMPPDLERHEIILGSFSLLFAASWSSILACWISNGGWSMVYLKFDEYSWWWWFLQWAVIFLYQDYATYWLHRIYHIPFLYKNFHKLHHKYKQPTAFSVTAIHPVEIMHVQLTLCVPLFAFPVHYVPFYAIVLYTYYHGIIDHSGINFKAYWWQPWQPDAIFHDNHHQYFHVNFGFNCFFWDKIHGTYRRKDRVYREDIFYGQGRDVKELTEQELQEEIEERKAENPNAYRGNEYEQLKLNTTRTKNKNRRKQKYY